ncbi:hypothetical protein, partial [Patulibacter medicamentivorans]|uniref:hypothetical protein n=1 Tax=Patulibacter medicamentivorans TaxID=1097667 RepID=UPI001B8AD79A
MTFTTGFVSGYEDGRIENVGTLNLNSEIGNIGGGFTRYGSTDVVPKFVNTGTVRKTVTTGTSATSSVGWAVDNDGSVRSGVGTLAFTGGSIAGSRSDGEWKGMAPAAQVELRGGSWSLGSGVVLDGNIGIGGSVSVRDVQGVGAAVR